MAPRKRTTTPTLTAPPDPKVIMPSTATTQTGITIEIVDDADDAFSRAGGRSSRFTIDPDLQDVIASLAASGKTAVLKLSDFPPARERTGPGQPMAVKPATLQSARQYLDLHAAPLNLGVQVRDRGDGTILVRARTRVQRSRKAG